MILEVGRTFENFVYRAMINEKKYYETLQTCLPRIWTC